MQLILRVASGPQAGQNATVRAGQVLQVGRTEFADFSVPSDPGIADVHFALDCGFDACRIRDLGSESGTVVNGEPITECTLRGGDSISAGQTVFTVEIEGEVDRPETDQADTAPSGYAKVECADAREICGHVELGEEAEAMLADGLTPRQFVELLRENELYVDAIRFLAHAMPNRDVVWWGSKAIEQAGDATESPLDANAHQATVNWVKEPTEEKRRAAEQAAAEVKKTTPAGMVALGAFYSEGSIAPPGLPEAPAGEFLTANAVSGGVLLAANCDDYDEARRRFAAFLDKGCEIADGGDGWE